MRLGYDVAEEKRVRVIIDTDAACEADDPFAIVQGLLSPKLIVKGIVAEHFVIPGSMEKSFEEMQTIVSIMKLDTSLYQGQKGKLKDDTEVSEGVRFIIEEALRESERRIAPCGAIGKHLFDNMIQYNMSHEAAWTQGESWSLGDSPAIAAAINPGCGHYEYAPAPVVGENTESILGTDRPMIRIYKDMDARYILEDLIAKLELFYGETGSTTKQ